MPDVDDTLEGIADMARDFEPVDIGTIERGCEEARRRLDEAISKAEADTLRGACFAPFAIADQKLADLRARVVAGLVDGTLKPRFHNGIGFAQVYLDKEVRLHVWHPDLPAEPEGFGCRHNHRFDFVSTVLTGSITNIWLDYEPDAPYGHFRRYLVQPAHLGAALPVLSDDGPLRVSIEQVQVVRSGERYSFPKGTYHESRGHGVTATVMKKLNQEDAGDPSRWAGILAPFNQAPEHGMERCTITDDALKSLVLRVVNQLDNHAWAAIAANLET